MAHQPYVLIVGDTPADRYTVSGWDELYAHVPDVGCRGLCHQSCGPIGLTPAEQDHTAAAGTRVPNAAVRVAAGQPVADTCPALSFLRVCSVYDARPMICRLWGATEQLPCPHGCLPDGGWLPDEQAKSLLRGAAELSRQQRERRRP